VVTCPICGSASATIQNHPTKDAHVVDCAHCGAFSVSGSLVSCLSGYLNNPDAAPKLSHVIRKAHEAGQQFLLDTYACEAILKNPLPRPREQADLLVQWLATNSPGPGEPINLDYKNHAAIAGAKSANGFSMLIEHLKGTGLIAVQHEKVLAGNAFTNVALTIAGWDHYETLRLGGTTYRKAFMAMKFGDAELDKLFTNVLKPAAKRAGFDLRKLDEQPKAGLIDDRMRVEIRASDFVVADLTHDNPGAYWEAGYAEGLGKPVIYTCKKSKFNEKPTHFDTNHHLTIFWDCAALEKTGDDLSATIRATLPHLAKLVDPVIQ
jgi:hypothetical protein